MPPSEQRRSTEGEPEPLRVEPLVADLRERLRETTEAARKLAEEARAGPAGPERPPPRGWGAPRAEQRPPADIADLVLLAEQTAGLLSEVARGLVPAELRQQFADAFRELLVAVRALLDWYLERLG